MLCSHLSSLGGIFPLTQSNETSDGCTCPSAALNFQKTMYTQEGEWRLPRGFHVSLVSFHRTLPLSAGRAAPAAECFSLYYTHRAWQGAVDALGKHLEAELSSHSPATQQIYPEAQAWLYFFKRELDIWLHEVVVWIMSSQKVGPTVNMLRLLASSSWTGQPGAEHLGHSHSEDVAWAHNHKRSTYYRVVLTTQTIL